MGLRRFQRPLVILALTLAFAVFPLLSYGFDQASASSAKGGHENAVEVSHEGRVKLGGIFVGASYTHFSGPLWGYPCSPFWGAGFDCGFWPYYSGAFSPYYPWGYFPYFAAPDYGGEIHLKTSDPTASVYLNSAYAGPVSKLKSFRLQPGVCDLELKTADARVFRQKIYVLTGKTLKIHATLRKENQEVQP